MATTYELFKDFAKEHESDEFLKKDVIAWFNKNHPGEKKEGTIGTHLIKFTTNDKNRVYCSVHKDGKDDLFFRTENHSYRLYNKATDPTPIYSIGVTVDPPDELDGREFAYERDLKFFLSKNLILIEPGLKLYDDEGITGIEFPVDGRFIDLLAMDKNNNYVVIELKVSRGYDRVIGQLLRYKNWIQKYEAEPGQTVRGMIIAKEITEDLVLACSGLKDIELYEYELSCKLKKKDIE
jgi:hypothetical protein